MALIQLQNIHFEVKGQTLFKLKQINLYPGDRIGLVGRNGLGKTSLLNIIAGVTEPDAGTVKTNTEVSFIPQLKPQNQRKSGGEISQTIIAEALIREGGVLLADEPTTHLDTEHVEKLERQLQEREEAMIIVSHDRAFLDALCTQIWEIEEGQLHVYQGNYSDYEHQKNILLKNHEKRYENYIQKRTQLENAMRQKEQKAQQATKKPKNISASEANILGAKPHFAKKQKKLNQGVKAIQSRLDQLDKVEKRREYPPVKMQVAQEETLRNRRIIRGDKIAGRAGEKILWDEFDFSITAGDKVAIIGPNGSGKTTFIRMILERRAGITISPSVSLGYFSQMLEVLDVEETILQNVQKTSIQDETLTRTVLARLGFFRDDVFKPIHVLSGGERVKVAFAKLFVSNANTLLLDEPTNYLDMEAVKALESLLVDYPGTVLLASHDRRFLENIATRVFHFQNKQVYSFEGSYPEYRKLEEEPVREQSTLEENLMKLDMDITDVLSRLSTKPTEELEQKFQVLLRKKKEINRRLDQ